MNSIPSDIKSATPIQEVIFFRDRYVFLVNDRPIYAHKEKKGVERFIKMEYETVAEVADKSHLAKVIDSDMRQLPPQNDKL